MDLDRQHAGFQRVLRVIVREIDRLHAVDVMPDVIPLGDDGQLVPVILVIGGEDAVRIVELAEDVAAGGVPADDVADQSDAASLPALFIEIAIAISRPRDLALVAADDPGVLLLRALDAMAAVLDARV